MSTDLPLGLSKVLLDLNADGIVDVLASGRLSNYPGKQRAGHKSLSLFQAAS